METRVLTFGSTAGFRELWDSFVPAHPGAWIGHLSANFAFADVAGIRNCSILLVDEKEKAVAALPLFETHRTDLRFFRTRILSSGLEFPAQPLIAGHLAARQQSEALEQLLTAAGSAARSSKADDLQIAYPAVIDGATAMERLHYCPLRHFGFTDENFVSLIIDLRPDIEEVSRLSDRSCRNMIRRAQKEGCSVRAIRDRAEWMRCHALARATLGDLAPSEKSHAAVWDHFIEPGLAATTAVIPPNGDAPSNVVVTAGWKDDWYYWMNYNDRGVRIPGANNLALWEAIACAKSRGAAFFELGSMEFSGGKNIAIADFKRSFGGTPAYQLRGLNRQTPFRHAILQQLAAVRRRWTTRAAG